MNPKQRRGLFTLVVAGVLAVVVFIALASYVSSVRADVGPKGTVFAAGADIGTFEAISGEDDVVEQQMPTKYITEQMITDREQLRGMKAATEISEGTLLQLDMLTGASSLADGEREISINFDSAQGINGRVQPGDIVDVVAAFARERETGTDSGYRRADVPYNVAGVLVRNARVVAVGAPGSGGLPGAADEMPELVDVVPVTFAVPVESANRLAYGEAFAVSMRIMRGGNNESGTELEDGDLSFEDPDLPPAMGSTESEGADD